MLQKVEFDGKTLLGGIVFALFFLAMFMVISSSKELPNKEIVKDMMLIIGPVLGLIAQALYRSTQADDRKMSNMVDALIAPSIVEAPKLLPAPQVEVSEISGQLEGLHPLGAPLVMRADGRYGVADQYVRPSVQPDLDSEGELKTEIME